MRRDAISIQCVPSPVDAIYAGYTVGLRTFADIVNAQREFYDAERDYSRALYAYILSVLRLKQAAGTLAPNDLQQVNRWLQNQRLDLAASKFRFAFFVESCDSFSEVVRATQTTIRVPLDIDTRFHGSILCGVKHGLNRTLR